MAAVKIQHKNCWQSTLQKKNNKHVICQPRSVRIGKNSALGLGYGPRSAASGRIQDLWHSFSQYGPPGRQITYMYLRESRAGRSHYFRDVIILEKLLQFSKCSPSALKRKARVFKSLQFKERFWKAPFSWRISVDRKPTVTVQIKLHFKFLRLCLDQAWESEMCCVKRTFAKYVIHVLPYFKVKVQANKI